MASEKYFQPDDDLSFEALAVNEDAADYSAVNPEMNLAWQFISNTSVSVFLTGKAGTGKTTFLRRLRELTPKRMVVLAPTGVAAINAGGQTLHSFFQLPFGPFIPGMPEREKGKHFKMSQRKKDLIRTLDLLVIDEVSMVRADLLDQVDDVLRRYRDSLKPFGGVQLLLIGDLMQLSPVAVGDEWAMLSEHYATPYFFSSKALAQLRYVTVELRHIYRQTDSRFIDLLAAVRDGRLTYDVINSLNARYVPDFDDRGEGWIRLTTHNATAQHYNDSRLAELPAPLNTFDAVIKDDFPEINFPTDRTLVLKVGAQVMFIKNDPSMAHAYYNGKIGTVTDIADDGITVRCKDEAEEIVVTPVTWDNTKYTLNNETKEIEEEVVGSFTQYPLRLAWAITVHKSQGLTFDHAVLDINASFAHGQVYVALSRCRSLEGLVLSSPLDMRSVITDRTVNEFIDREAGAMEESIRQLPQYKFDYMLQLLDELYDFREIGMTLGWMARVVEEHLSRQQAGLLYRLRSLAEPLDRSLTQVASKFRNQYIAYMLECGGNINGSPLLDRIRESAAYFSAKIAAIFDDVLADCAISINNKQVIKTYNHALTDFRIAVISKELIFKALTEQPFSVRNYLNIKAKSILEATNAKPAKPNREKPASFLEAIFGATGSDLLDRLNGRGKAPKKSRTADEATTETPQNTRTDAGATTETKKKKSVKAPKAPKIETHIKTLELFRAGNTSAQIAAERGLTEGTIYHHLAKLSIEGRINLYEVMSAERFHRVIDAARNFTGAYTLTDLHALLPDYTFAELRFALDVAGPSAPTPTTNH